MRNESFEFGELQEEQQQPRLSSGPSRKTSKARWVDQFNKGWNPHFETQPAITTLCGCVSDVAKLILEYVDYDEVHSEHEQTGQRLRRALFWERYNISTLRDAWKYYNAKVLHCRCAECRLRGISVPASAVDVNDYWSTCRMFPLITETCTSNNFVWRVGAPALSQIDKTSWFKEVQDALGARNLSYDDTHFTLSKKEDWVDVQVGTRLHLTVDPFRAPDTLKFADWIDYFYEAADAIEEGRMDRW